VRFIDQQSPFSNSTTGVHNVVDAAVFVLPLDVAARGIVRRSSDNSTTCVGFPRAPGHGWVQPF
jgi:hypothetical protein